MNKKTIFSSLLIVVILLFSSQLIFAGFRPIYPLEGSIIGGQYDQKISQWQLINKAVYDYNSSTGYYYLGTKYQFTNSLTGEVNYSRWLNHDLPDYLYQQGGIGKLYYSQSLKQKVSCALFTGQVGKELSEKVDTTYLNLAYNRELYYDWKKRVNLKLDITSGQEAKTEKTYYSAEMELPIKLNKFFIQPTLGYIKQGDKIKPSYDLSNYVLGYDDQSGTQVVNCKLERQVRLFPTSDLPVINFLKGVGFVTAGDVLKKGELLSDFKLHSSVGVGVTLNLGPVDFRLLEAITDQGTTDTLFRVTAGLPI